MKKVISISLLAIMLCLFLTGCTQNVKNETITNTNEDVVAEEKEWTLTYRESNVMFSDDVQKAFDDANKDYQAEDFKIVGLLGKQVVAGTNYMFLCKAEDAYKVVIVYKDLSGKSQITNVNTFDVKKYVNKNAELNTEVLTGGWQTEIPGKPIMLEEDVQSAFDQATEKMTGTTYFPISTLAKQEENGTNYAVLCYGRLSDANATEGVFVLTLNVDETNKSEIVAISAVDLKEYNK